MTRKQKSPRQQARALIETYKKLVEERYGRKPILNSNSLSWGFIDAINDLGYGDAKKALEYFFTCDSPGHDVYVYLNKYEKLHENRLKVEEDARKRVERLRKTAAMVAALDKKNEEAAHGEH
ncbi:hypothetical protein SEA_EVY_76 [Streptomyces phage Evy]|uniref:Uncharacterized protein n=3 Tax=Samistivirus TaxID=2560220 RepID=A0A221SAY0_9CAUD|nr:hypothetical protein AXJ18_gp196 [Streptomyces phage Jay2Jay]YP_010103452.1 hypothetical protein KNU67_gp189 [Streptomyces phage Evy]ASN73153.1 hypothetical protein SEA_WARPY_79 [Streptomyces phage Warpy]UEM46864.1 hypothetical protein SEA_TARGARYEN_76 [Streptomyces phage Targaryen]AIW02578.1 hypothetical protein PBI_JAY2JAY_80 [Streptomyces phage Jay2Jay]QDH93943.1 hypothetical protein SEA_EVY_76 [Streptomyces phage Evy]